MSEARKKVRRLSNMTLGLFAAIIALWIASVVLWDLRWFLVGLILLIPDFVLFILVGVANNRLESGDE